MEDKTLDTVVAEYEQKLKEKDEELNKKIEDLNKQHIEEIKSIISGRKTVVEKEVGKEKEEQKDFFTEEIEKTKKKLKIKKEEN